MAYHSCSPEELLDGGAGGPSGIPEEANSGSQTTHAHVVPIHRAGNFTQEDRRNIRSLFRWRGRTLGAMALTWPMRQPPFSDFSPRGEPDIRELLRIPDEMIKCNSTTWPSNYAIVKTYRHHLWMCLRFGPQ